MIDQKIGSVTNNELVNSNGQGIMRLEGVHLGNRPNWGWPIFSFSDLLSLWYVHWPPLP